MRIAVLVISLCLTMIVGLQSCAVMVGGNITSDTDTAAGGAAGIILAFLFVLGAAFAMGLPRVAMVMFGLAALIGLLTAATTVFSDMWIWGGIALVLSVMSWLGYRELAKKKNAAAAPVGGVAQ
ncbi:hypothetical protein [Pelagibacterium montanilacus]|uniref:hypothetical protein n=2 Tax=Pelagibacterium montanilacus TaxID=2185280 RepID=UPI000F8D896C|nr:hypothetical protein [Pelagibacterium montanilacus]